MPRPPRALAYPPVPGVFRATARSFREALGVWASRDKLCIIQVDKLLGQASFFLLTRLSDNAELLHHTQGI